MEPVHNRASVRKTSLILFPYKSSELRSSIINYISPLEVHLESRWTRGSCRPIQEKCITFSGSISHQVFKSALIVINYISPLEVHLESRWTRGSCRRCYPRTPHGLRFHHDRRSRTALFTQPTFQQHSSVASS